MGLSESEFWSLTPKEFVALLNQWKYAEKRQDYRSALICSVIANVHKGKKGRAFKPSDFMPKEQEERKPQSWQEQLQIVEIWNKALGGIDKRKSEN